MTNPRHPLRLNVGFIVIQSIGYSRDFHFEFPQIQLQDLKLEHFAGLARISRTPQGLLVQCKFQGVVDEQCVRCLIDFHQLLEIDFSDLYAFSSRSVSESGLMVPEDNNIDLEPLVYEYMLIAIPISPVCKPDCKGLCAECGEDLNQNSCEHQKIQI